VSIYDLREKKDMLNRIILIANNMIKVNKVVFSVPGIGFLSLRTYPNIVKTRTVIAIAKGKITEDTFRIFVDL
jgi:hypothetical protein